MTIRLYIEPVQVWPSTRVSGAHLIGIDDGRVNVATCDTREEAKQAKRAFELVLAPRFTRDEAIAIVKAVYSVELDPTYAEFDRGYRAGLRLALEALEAAGVFVPCNLCEGTGKGAVVRSKGFWHEPDSCCKCSPTMADLLDAAGIR